MQPQIHQISTKRTVSFWLSSTVYSLKYFIYSSRNLRRRHAVIKNDILTWIKYIFLSFHSRHEQVVWHFKLSSYDDCNEFVQLLIYLLITCNHTKVNTPRRNGAQPHCHEPEKLSLLWNEYNGLCTRNFRANGMAVSCGAPLGNLSVRCCRSNCSSQQGWQIN